MNRTTPGLAPDPMRPRIFRAQAKGPMDPGPRRTSGTRQARC
jgi:hypothetical protein